MTFDQLDFKPNLMTNGVYAQAFFPNGYGASVIRSEYSYGGRKGLYELAVLRGNVENFSLCYTTPITSDVCGCLTPAEVTALLAQVEALDAN